MTDPVSLVERAKVSVKGFTHPGIAAACFLIALDNGGINRERSENRWRMDYAKWIARREEPNIREIDAWLASLSESDLDTVCTGEHRDVQRLLAIAPAFTGDLLNDYFDEVC